MDQEHDGEETEENPTAAPQHDQHDHGTFVEHDPIFDGAIISLASLCVFVRRSEKMNGTFVNVFALWNTMMGTTTLAIAWGIDKAGLAAGVILVLSIGSLTWFTSRLIIKLYQRHGREIDHFGDLGELCRLLLGRNYELVVKITTVFSMICCIIIYYILMSSFLFDLVNLVHDYVQSSRNELTHPLNSKENPSSKIWNLRTVPLYLIVIIMPLVNIKTPVFFTKFNALGTLASAYIILFVLVKGILWGVNVDLRDKGSVHYTPLFRPVTFPILTGMLTMSFCIHATVITVVRSNKYPKRNVIDLAIGFMLGTFTYMFLGVFFYVCYPDHKTKIKDNILDLFSSTDVMAAIARALLLFQLSTNYVLVTYGLRRIILLEFFKKVYPGIWAVFILNSSLVFVCVLVAIFFPRIGTLIRYFGAISGLFITFVIPCLIHSASLKRRDILTYKHKVLYTAITLFAVANFVAQMFMEV